VENGQSFHRLVKNFDNFRDIENILPLLAKYLLDLTPEFRIHNDFVRIMKKFLTIESILKIPPSEKQKSSMLIKEKSGEPLNKFNITWFQKSLDNYNYDLGFNIDMMQLHMAIDGRRGFISTYSNMDSNEVRIGLKYKIPETLKGVIKSNKQGKHFSFSVYRGGRVTQSGPCRKLNKLAYYLFRSTIIEILSEEQYNGLVYRKLIN